MKISEVILKLKQYYRGYGQINSLTTRDKVLYGDTDHECTGIVTTCWASVDVINKASELGANLIICHEALFWNHGDQTDWLDEQHNQTYLEKKALLDQTKITVWRNHDYIHSGIPLADGSYQDGIFYGLLHQLGWKGYVLNNEDGILSLKIPPMNVIDVTQHLINKLNLSGARIIGSKDTIVRKINIPYHILGDAKKEITQADKDNFDLFIALELIDFTLSEYIRDSSQLGLNKVIIACGHFNIEEPGMKYLVNYLPYAINSDIKCTFIPSGDMYHYIKA